MWPDSTPRRGIQGSSASLELVARPRGAYIVDSVPTLRRRMVFGALLASAVACAGTAVQTQSKPPATEPHTEHAAPPAAFNGRIALYTTAMGPFTRPISSRNSEAQAFFNQGFQLTYAFARPEAVRSFREAETRDPECAICYWGEAWAWGSDLNWTMSAEEAPLAYAAIQKAVALAPAHATPIERRSFGRCRSGTSRASTGAARRSGPCLCRRDEAGR